MGITLYSVPNDRFVKFWVKLKLKTSEVKADLFTEYDTMCVDYARDTSDVQRLQSLLEPHIMCAQRTKMSVVMKNQSG
jgi:hypothetical protein